MERGVGHPSGQKNLVTWKIHLPGQVQGAWCLVGPSVTRTAAESGFLPHTVCPHPRNPALLLPTAWPCCPPILQPPLWLTSSTCTLFPATVCTHTPSPTLRLRPDCLAPRADPSPRSSSPARELLQQLLEAVRGSLLPACLAPGWPP